MSDFGTRMSPSLATEATLDVPSSETKVEHQLQILLGHAALIADERRLPRLIELIRDMGKAVARADRCSVWVLDWEYDELYTVASEGIDQVRIPSNAGLQGLALTEGQPILIKDAHADPRFDSESDGRTGYRTRSMMVLPFWDNNGEPLGCFQVVNKITPDAVFSESDLRLMGLVASYAGKALESAMLNQEVEQTQRELLLKLGEVCESRSKDTGQHVRRVADYSYVLALKIGLPEQDAELLKMVSPMHDVGKVSIPDSILNKPGKLSEEDFALMKLHTIVGYDIFKGSKGRVMSSAAIVAWQHHEKWNGTGYPRGISGEQIHIFARITAVADVFDALASERVYKRAWPIDKVMKLFEEERGKHFDPQLVDALVACLPDILEIREQLNDPPGFF